MYGDTTLALKALSVVPPILIQIKGNLNQNHTLILLPQKKKPV